MKNISEILQKENPVLIDVRSHQEFREGHIQGAKNIPLDEIPRRVDEIKSLSGPVILYCRSGSRSGMAVDFLKKTGMKKIYNGGGIFDMQQAKMN